MCAASLLNFNNYQKQKNYEKTKQSVARRRPQSENL